MIGELLAEIRRDHGDTQQALADRLHVSRYTVSSWEQGKTDPDHETLVQICRIYRCSADYLLGITDVDGFLLARQLEKTRDLINRAAAAYPVKQREERR